MNNDEKERNQQWKMMKKREKTMNSYETYMKNDEQERKKQWKMMKQIEKTMKHDEK